MESSPEPRGSSDDTTRLLGQEVVTSDDCSEIISLSKLSTTCLGADMKTKEKDGLEPSCAVHVFPNSDIMIKDAMRVLNAGTLVWHPSSSVTAGPKEKFKKEFTLHNPTPTLSMRTPDISEGHKNSSKQHPRSKSESRIDFPAISLALRGSVLVSDVNMSKQAKLGQNENNRTSSSQDTKAPFITKGKFTKSLRHKYAGYVRSKKLHRSRSEPNFVSLPKPSPPNNDKKYSVKPYPSELTNFPDNMKVMPVYTLWTNDDKANNTVEVTPPTELTKHAMDGERLQKVAEYILNESTISSSMDFPLRQEIAVADGVWSLMFHTLAFSTT